MAPDPGRCHGAAAMKNDPEQPENDKALVRHNAVSWIQQATAQGHTLRDALELASRLTWNGRFYSPRTLEDWYYLHLHQGFGALKPKVRQDKGKGRVLSPEAEQAIMALRQEHPSMRVSTLIAHLEKQGILVRGGYHKSAVYRFLKRRGFDRARLRARALLEHPHAPTKAFEMPYANALWMADMMYGPTLCSVDPLTGEKHTTSTYLFALIDDCSRLVPHAEYYSSGQLRYFLDLLKQGCQRRGIPDKLYTDNGKVFRSKHLQIVCANLDIKLIHAKPYAAWSKGKIERFFSRLQQQFQAALVLDPVHTLQALNARLFYWLETDYHQRAHDALGGESPAKRFIGKLQRLRSLPAACEPLFWTRVIRRVRQDATVTLDGALYEVPVHLQGAQVELRYDPMNIETSGAEIWYGGLQAGLARPLDKHLNATIHRRRPSGNNPDQHNQSSQP